MKKRNSWKVAQFVAAAITLNVLLVSNAVAQQNYSEEELIAVLASDAPKAEKAITCKRLAVFGTENAVPELAKLLPDEQLTSWARTALEVIPGPAADEALREAMEVTKGRTLVGVINSIAFRRDEEAVSGLIEQLKSDNEQVAGAAAVALGHIGGIDATNALETSLANSPDSIRSTVAEGCIIAAEGLLESGDVDAAAKLYERVRAADVSQQRVIEAIRGIIVARQSIPLLVEQLQSDDEEFFGIGLRTSRELKGPEVTEALVAALESANPQRQALVVLSLAERDPETVLPAILKLAKGKSSNARTSAMQVLGKIGNASCLQTLVDAASGTDERVAEAAMDAIASINDENINAEIKHQLQAASGRQREVLITAIGLRRIDAVAELVKAADDRDSRIRAAALTALGSTVDQSDLKLLIGRVTDSKYKRDFDVALRALRTACVRMPDRDKCSSQLTDAMARAPINAQQSIIGILGQVGGEKALETVGKAAASRRDELKDAASQTLGKWMSPDAAPVLLKLAQPKANSKYQVRALRGYLRIARQMKLSNAERAQMCDNAFATAGRDDERLLALKVLEIHPSVDGLLVASEAQSYSAIADEAKRTATTIASKINGQSELLVKLLQEGKLQSAEIEILRATYGAGDTTKDVTNIIKKNVGKLPIVKLASSSYNSSFGGDPAPGVVKQLVVEYKINGTKGTASFNENSPIVLPMPE